MTKARSAALQDLSTSRSKPAGTVDPIQKPVTKEASAAAGAEVLSEQRPLQLGALRDNLGYLSRALRSVGTKTSGEYVAELGFLAGQMVMLGFIAANDGITQNELAGAMLMKKSQVTHLIHDLVARGLVTREEHAGDRRFNALRLTRTGNQVWRRTQTRIDAHSEHLFSPLEDAERTQLAALLRKLLAHHLGDSGIDFR